MPVVKEQSVMIRVDRAYAAWLKRQAESSRLSVVAYTRLVVDRATGAVRATLTAQERAPK